jgi:hypothetical protein
MTDERDENGSSRRDVVTGGILVACTAFPFLKVIFDAKEIAEAPTYSGEYVPSADEIAGLGNDLLFKELKQFSAELARANPYYGDSSGPSPSSQYALRSALNRLGLSSPAETVSNLITQAEGSLVFFGGPNNNAYSRAILGTGDGSPLLQLIEPKTKGILPCMFRTTGAPELGMGREPKWDFLINGERVTWPDDCLVITVMPNPYSVLRRPGDRIVVLAGRYRASMYAIDHVLSDYKLLRQLAKETRNWTAWQAAIRVHSNDLEAPSSLGEAKAFRIETNFEDVNVRGFAGQPLLSNPHNEEAKELLGLLPLIPVSTGRLMSKPSQVGLGLRGIARSLGKYVADNPDRSRKSPPNPRRTRRNPWSKSLRDKVAGVSDAEGAIEDAPSMGTSVGSPAREKASPSKDKTDEVSARGSRRVRITPGTYTLATLPPLSAGARKILDELEAEEEVEKKLIDDLQNKTAALSVQNLDRQAREQPPKPGRVGLRLTRKGGVGLRLTPPKK